MRHYAIALTLAVLVPLLWAEKASAQASFDPAASTGTSILDQMTVVEDAKFEKTKDGVEIRGTKVGASAGLKTKAVYKLPVTITAVVKSTSTIRLTYARGLVMLSAPAEGELLRYRGPRAGALTDFPGKGGIRRDQWITVQWVVTNQGSRIFVDGEERASAKGDYSGTEGPIGIGTWQGATAVFRSVTVSSNSDPGPAPATPTKPKGDVSIDVPVSTKPPAGGPAAPAEAVDPNAIERPEYARKAKPLVKNVTSVTAMVVRTSDDGDQIGYTADIIATVKPDSRGGDKAGAGFYRADGDETMKVSFQEAMRAIALRYPYWEPGRIEVGFGEKFTSHGGPSAGVAFALLVLSTLEGFDLDPRVAVTGDITVDWRVRKVGGVTAKIRGATLDKCEHALIPEDNATAFADMGVLYGPKAFYEIQVFTIANLQDAIALARKDRPAALTEATTRFSELQKAFATDEKATLKELSTQVQLKKILELAPNHVSARNLLAVCDGSAPRVVSNNSTLYQLSVIFYPYAKILVNDSKLTRDTLAPHVTMLARKRLATLRPIASKELQPLVADVAAMIEAMDSFAAGGGSMANLKQRWQNMAGRYATTFDRSMMEKLIREGY